MAQTLSELAAKQKTVFGISKGEKDFCFMRDFYNLLDILQKTALTTSWVALEEDQSISKEDLEKMNTYLTRFGAAAKSVYALGGSNRTEVCHVLKKLMDEASQDTVKAKAFGTYAVAFLQATMSMPLMIPEFGRALDDGLSDDARLHSMLLTGLEQLEDTDRRKMLDALISCGLFSSSFNVTAIKRTLPADVKKLLDELEQKSEESSNVSA